MYNNSIGRGGNNQLYSPSKNTRVAESTFKKQLEPERDIESSYLIKNGELFKPQTDDAFKSAFSLERKIERVKRLDFEPTSKEDVIFSPSIYRASFFRAKDLVEASKADDVYKAVLKTAPRYYYLTPEAVAALENGQPIDPDPENHDLVSREEAAQQNKEGELEYENIIHFHQQENTVSAWRINEELPVNQCRTATYHPIRYDLDKLLKQAESHPWFKSGAIVNTVSAHKLVIHFRVGEDKFAEFHRLGVEEGGDNSEFAVPSSYFVARMCGLASEPGDPEWFDIFNANQCLK